MKNIRELEIKIANFQTGFKDDPIDIQATQSSESEFCYGDLVDLGFMTRNEAKDGTEWMLNEDAGFFIKSSYNGLMLPGDIDYQ